MPEKQKNVLKLWRKFLPLFFYRYCNRIVGSNTASVKPTTHAQELVPETCASRLVRETCTCVSESCTSFYLVQGEGDGDTEAE